ncbi:MAG TPA: hypothetical protein PKD37_02305 [Oligoflexia bacterium]|nr:hypothetical protein [Oligoflexia bacterium]HMP26803.1 hypothetical protein [Oligoflexia bacterium]
MKKILFKSALLFFFLTHKAIYIKIAFAETGSESFYSLSDNLKISKENLRQFKKLILPETEFLINSSQLSVKVRSQILPQGLNSRLHRVRTFHSFEVLPDASIGVIKQNEGTDCRNPPAFAAVSDPLIKAKYTLWSDQFCGYPFQRYDFELNLPETEFNGGLINGTLRRYYPGFDFDKSIVLYKERIEFPYPSPKNSFILLNFRLLTPEEDPFWVRSFLLPSFTQMTSVNMQDPFFKKSFAPADFFSFSLKPSNYEYNQKVEDTLLLPFAFGMPRVERESEFCLLVEPKSEFADGSLPKITLDQNVTTNQESDEEPYKASDPFSFNTFFVPRQVQVVTFMPKDPYAEVGKEILYVDQQLGRLIARMVYDQMFHPAKLVFTVYGLFERYDEPTNYEAFPVYQLLYDFKTKIFQNLNFHRMIFCDKVPKELDLRLFDPITEEPTVVPPATKTK